MRRAGAWIVIGAAAVPAACGLPKSGDGPTSLEVAPDGSPGPDDADEDAQGGDGSAVTDAPDDDGTTSSTCPGAQGPAMVDVGGYCVDSTEVTQAQYLLFVNAEVSLGSQPVYCMQNGTWVPSGQWPPSGAGTLPVTSVTWCDALGYCAWAGKRLCGKIGGGSADPVAVNVAASDQWFSACSHAGDGQHAYPYGNTYGGTTCNGIDANAGDQIVEPVGSFTGCVGGYAGLLDMSGNVREWEDSCGAMLGPDDLCNQRGGSVNSNQPGLACNAANLGTRNSSNDHLGFRCCAP
jgi:sulfatase modifying factor 1